MRTIYTTGTIDLGDGPIPPDSMVDIDDAEAERLIALGVAVDPDARIVIEESAVATGDDVAALIAERDALLATVAEARDANDAFHVKHGEMQAALDVAQAEVAQCKSALEASHSEIDRLTKALAAAEKKK